MEIRRFVLVMATLTAVFCAAVILYNFQIMPPYGSAGTSAVTVLQTAAGSFRPSGASSSEAGRSGVVVAGSAETAPAADPSASSVSGATGTSLSSASSSKTAGSGRTSSAAVSYPVNINTADAQQLATLPGIGDTLAQRIIDYRQENGAFTSVDELDNVKGIGTKTIEKLRPYATV